MRKFWMSAIGLVCLVSAYAAFENPRLAAAIARFAAPSSAGATSGAASGTSSSRAWAAASATPNSFGFEIGSQYSFNSHIVEVGDLTGDGRDDVVAIGSFDPDPVQLQVFLFTQQTDGKLTTPTTFNLPGDIMSQSVHGTALADLNDCRLCAGFFG